MGIKVFSSDKVWSKILSDLGATVIDTPDLLALNFDDLDIKTPVSCIELKAIIINALDDTKILKKVFGKDTILPNLQSQIIIRLYKTGGMSISELKASLGYLPSMTTHTVDTAIYQLRKTYGHDFIKNEAGIYRLGKI